MDQSKEFNVTTRGQCWEKAQKILGRDPDRWRYDAVGTPVLKELHGKVLNSLVNMRKGNKVLTNDELMGLKNDVQLNEKGMDVAEAVVYGHLNDESKKLKCKFITRNQAQGIATVPVNQRSCELCLCENGWTMSKFKAFLRKEV